MAIAETITTTISDKASTVATKTATPGVANAGDVQAFNHAMQANHTNSATAAQGVQAQPGMLAMQKAPTALPVNMAGSLQAATHKTKPTIGDKLLSKLDKLRDQSSNDMEAINTLLEQDDLSISDTYLIQQKMNQQMVMYELVSQIASALSRHANTLLTAQ